MRRLDVAAAATLPHRRALVARFRAAIDEESEGWREGRRVAAPEVRAARRDGGDLKVEARRIDEQISALRSEHGVSDGSSRARSATVRRQQVRSCRDQSATRNGCQQRERNRDGAVDGAHTRDCSLRPSAREQAPEARSQGCAIPFSGIAGRRVALRPCKPEQCCRNDAESRKDDPVAERSIARIDERVDDHEYAIRDEGSEEWRPERKHRPDDVEKAQKGNGKIGQRANDARIFNRHG